jgi:hypothetical protein
VPATISPTVEQAASGSRQLEPTECRLYRADAFSVPVAPWQQSASLKLTAMYSEVPEPTVWYPKRKHLRVTRHVRSHKRHVRW